MYKKTKIVATISDARCDIPLLQQLYDAGMNVVRLNTAHQNPEGMRKVIDNVRQVSSRIAILVDTKGPEVRTTQSASPITYKKGEEVRVTGNPDLETTHDLIAVSYPNFVNDLTIGSKILIDDGDLGLVVVAKEKDALVCEVENDATMGSRKSVNVPGAHIQLPALTEKDRSNIEFAVDYDVDFIAHSFVRSRADVEAVREILRARGSDIHIVAKIENQEGVDNIDEIIAAADGIMIARGDLGIEVPEQYIPGIQRRIIDKCIRAHKPVIVATQMLQSMIKNPRPTRTEVTDIANAVYSRTDALMLSGETAYGDYPVKAVETMASIAWQAEHDTFEGTEKINIPLPTEPDVTEFFAKEAVDATKLMKLRAIIIDSFSGRTARYVASYRSESTALAICYKAKTVKYLALSYGVYAFHMPIKSFGHAFLLAALKRLIKDKMLSTSDRICYLGSQRKDQSTSFMEMNTVQNFLAEEDFSI